ncbi:DUF1631 domain-containing protein [Oleiagrimonas sp. C23AA]|uniref:DUF1631 domain-containing protein n=1 Tax=Oleiagrimonas sp. C23AA TaxID=2719047 RepID=UPI00141DE833|nr:DUF1631 domain-containing protein [Oleiagrimonas sp. C23AA]NII11475.1 DUF1631 domain-containing protein [Oleiagrimonas sp. C23AA]
MNNAKDPSNIVDLSRRTDPRNERIGALQVRVRDLARQKLQGLCATMFENADDALFDLAEKAENNAAQTQYFDGMREVRKKRSLIERVFVDGVARNLSEFAAGRQIRREETGAAEDAGSGELSLVDDTELEESLAITSMVGKTESRLQRPLYALNQRLSVICGGASVDDAGNPLAPSLLGQAFRASMRELSVEMRVKLIIYKLFDRYVMSGLDGLYETLNDELVKAGVLPQLRHGGAPRSSTGPATPAMRGDESRSEADAAPVQHAEDPQRVAVRDEVMRTLHELLASRRQPEGAAGPGSAAERTGRDHAAASAPSLSPAELLGALSLLQSQAAEQFQAPLPHGKEASVSEADTAELKRQLQSQIRRLRGEAHTRMSGADEDTIDLVGMLFEFILQDHNLPVDMQVLLARLQIPYLKAAILDRRLFAHAQHPARRLLDALAEAAKSWSPGADRDRDLYNKVREIVETLMQDFDDDLGIFERLQADLQQFLDIHRRRAELSEQRVAEATQGREKLARARRRAAQEIRQRTEHTRLPEMAQGILTRAWANYLVLTQLRQGEDSGEFSEALRFIDDFTWSMTPPASPEQRQRLRQLLPSLEKSLRHGLSTVAFQDSDIDKLIGQLHGFYRQALREDPAASVPPPGLERAPPMPASVPAISETSAEDVADESALEAQQPPPDDEAMARVRQLKPGTWVEFVGAGAEGANERAKLSWISPISGRYLFVNRRGLKVGDRTADELAVELADGRTIVLEELPLFDRALDAIVERLRKTPTGAPPEPESA